MLPLNGIIVAEFVPAPTCELYLVKLIPVVVIVVRESAYELIKMCRITKVYLICSKIYMIMMNIVMVLILLAKYIRAAWRPLPETE
jgi:hypothetical protein